MRIFRFSILAVLSISSLNAFGSIEYKTQISPDEKLAEFYVAETGTGGILYKFFKDLNTLQKTNNTSHVKDFSLSNGQFQIHCENIEQTMTSCRMVVASGSDFQSSGKWTQGRINQIGSGHITTIMGTGDFSKEMQNLLPTSDGTYSIKLAEKVVIILVNINNSTSQFVFSSDK